MDNNDFSFDFKSEPENNEWALRDYAPSSEKGAEDPLQAYRDSQQTDPKLRKTMFGYTRSSVGSYLKQVNRSSEQMQSNMEEQIRSLSMECTRLTKEGDVLRSQLRRADAERALIQERANKAEMSLDERDRARSEAEMALAEAEQKREEAEQARIAAEQARMAAEQARDNAEKARLAAEQSLSEAEQKREEAEQSLSEAEQARVQAEKTCDEAMRNADQMQTMLMEMQERVEESEKQGPMQNMGSLAEIEQLYKQREQGLGSALSSALKGKEEAETRLSELTLRCRELETRTKDLSDEKEAVAELLSQYQSKEQEFALIRKKNEECREIIAQQGREVTNLVVEMEKQLELYNQLSDARENDKKMMYEMMRKDAELRTQNTELLAEIEELTRKTTMLEQEMMLKDRRLNAESMEADEMAEERPMDTSIVDAMSKAREIIDFYAKKRQEAQEPDFMSGIGLDISQKA